MLFYNTRKKIIYNKQDPKILPLPLKSTCKQKIQIQLKSRENCTKPGGGGGNKISHSPPELISQR